MPKLAPNFQLLSKHSSSLLDSVSYHFYSPNPSYYLRLQINVPLIFTLLPQTRWAIISLLHSSSTTPGRNIRRFFFHSHQSRRLELIQRSLFHQSRRLELIQRSLFHQLRRLELIQRSLGVEHHQVLSQGAHISSTYLHPFITKPESNYINFTPVILTTSHHHSIFQL
jgi:hypothetical protein